MNSGWPTALQTYFLHSSSSRYAHRTKSKPCFDSATILIPFHVHGAHWVTIARWMVSGRTYFLCSDNLNSARTEALIRDYLLSLNTLFEFNPPDSIWINCRGFTYYPRSNECGPRSLLALSVFCCTTVIDKSILLPFMHTNLAQICRWWVGKILITASFT